MPDRVIITTEGIKQNLKRLQFTPNTFYKSVAEYIWNGFDAKATEVKLNYQFSETRTLKELVITPIFVSRLCSTKKSTIFYQNLMTNTVF